MDNWYFSRQKLAEQYLKILDVGISSYIAIIAPRRKGKTLFVLNDVSTIARKSHYIPIYTSLWHNINAPHEGLISACEEILEALEKKIPFASLLKAKVKKASLGNELIGKLEIELADQPSKTSNTDLIKLDQLLSKLEQKAKAKGKTILLLVDEIQHLATSSHFDALTHALRTMLDKRSGRIKALFTGSSRHYMNLLFNEIQSPFYHFAERVPFPDLDKSFIHFLMTTLSTQHHVDVSAHALCKAFKAVDYSPYWMMKIISHMITFSEKLHVSLTYVLQLIEVAEGFEQIAKKLKPIDIIVFQALSVGQSPFSKTLLKKIEEKTTVKGVYPNIQRSLQRLITHHLVTQISKGQYEIEKPGFAEYLLRTDKKHAT